MSQNSVETAQTSCPDALDARLSACDSHNTIETPAAEQEIIQNSFDASTASDGLLAVETGVTADSETVHDVGGVLHPYPKMTTRSNKSAVLASADSVDDFKRARTKFTSEQICELEAFFVQRGPHPTRAQRLAMAETLEIPPRVVQIYLQNRRQRDAKNKSAAVSVNSAKEKAKASIVVAPLSGREGATEPTATRNAFVSVVDAHATFQAHENHAPSDALESMRSFEALSGQSAWTFSSSPTTILLGLGELDTPSRPASQLYVAGIDGRPMSSVRSLDNNTLWTRILSSPPSPATSRRRLYETLRQSFLAQPAESSSGRELSESLRSSGTALETASVNLPVGEAKGLERKSSKIDLACAIARDVKAGSKPTTTGKVGEASVVDMSRGRTMSGMKRLREETDENEAPRKRTASLPWSGYIVTPKAPVTGMESVSTPKNTITASSPGSSNAPSMSSLSSSATLCADPIQGLHYAYKLPPTVQRIDALSELEANAALVLASLSFNV